MKLVGTRCTVRPWRMEDADAVVRHANNLNVARQLRDRFPHPYTRANANAFLKAAVTHADTSNLAIEVNGEAAGAIGYVRGMDVERYSAEIGYWLGEAYWNRGIATAVVRGFTDYAFEAFDLCRIYANVFAWNPASGRVLEKAGYQLEGRLRKSAVKDGQVLDGLLYATVREFRGVTR